METAPTARRHDIDWLRVLATYLLFVFHGAMVFNPAPFYHVRNADLSFAALIACGFIGLWHMPLFFLLAGWSAAASLAVRGPRGFLKERVSRLLIPLLVGCALFGPAIKYVELQSGLDLSHTGLRVQAHLQDGFRQIIPSGLALAPPFDEGFLAFLPTFFTRFDRFTWAHLWFLAYLFTFSVLYRPLFSWLLARRGAIGAPRAALVYLPIVPLALIQVTLRPRWPGVPNLYGDWANVAYYSTYLLAGFLLACHPVLEEAVQREWKRALAIGLAAMAVLLASVLGLIASPTVLLAGSAVAGWCCVIALLGLAGRFLAFGGRALAYLAESALPVYVLHQAAIVLPGYAIVVLPLGILPKFTLLLVTSVGMTLAVYHFVVRPFAPVRLAFGMRPRRPAITGAPALAASVFVGLALLAGTATSARAATAPLGLWYAEGGAAEVAIDRCGDALCGRVVWLRSPFDEDGCDLRDRNNPDADLRSRPVLGLHILQDLRQSSGEPGVWTGGTIYDPTSGRTYRCRLSVDGELLKLRGYVGIPLVGRTTSWVRVGAERRWCQAREGDR